MDTKEIRLNHDKDYIKIIYFTDTHYNATNPENRKDNMLETNLLKLEEITDIANTNKADVVIHGGDLFEKADVTDLVAGRVAKRFRNFNMPVVVIPGGHDLFGNNIDSIKRTKLGFFNQSGLVELLIHPSQDCIMIKNNNISLQLTGTASHYGIDVDNIDGDYILKYKNADFAIHTIHGMLMPKPFIPNTPTVLIDDIAGTEADLTLSGHYHMGFEPTTVNGKLFANCGAVIRKKNDLKEITRMPQVYMITVSKKNGITIETIKLKTAKPGDEVLDRSKIIINQQRNVKIQGFLGQVKQTQNLKNLNINTIVQEISKNKKLPQEVVKLTLDRISKIQELLEAGNQLQLIDNNGKLKYIKKIIIHNFQAHADTIIDLEDGINLFVGESDNGKSAAIRAMKWVLYNEPKGDSYIRYDTIECYVTLVMSDGYEITRMRRKENNSYIVKSPNGEETKYEKFKNEVPVEVISATGIMKAQIDTNKELMLNLNEQLDPPFLLKEPGSVKAKAIGSIVKTNILDSADRDIQKDIGNNNTKLKDIESQIKDNSEELEKYKDIDKAENNLKRMGILIEKLKKVNTEAEKLKYFQDKIKNASNEILNIQRVLTQLTNLPQLELLYMNLNDLYKTQKQMANYKNKMDGISKEIKIAALTSSRLEHIDILEEKRERLEDIYSTQKVLKAKSDSIKEIDNEIKKQKSTLKNLQQLDKLEAKYKNLDKSYNVFKVLSEKKKSIDNLNKEISKENIIIHRLKQVPVLEEKYIKLDGLRKTTEKLSSISVKYNEVKNSIKKGNDFIVENAKNLDDSINKYVENLKIIGKCPTCTHVITDKEIVKIAKELKGEAC